MRILRIRVFSQRVTIYLVVILIMNAGLNLIPIISWNEYEGGHFIPLALLGLLAGLVGYYFLLRRRVKQGKWYLTITGKTVFVHETGIWGKEHNKPFLDVGQFKDFFIRKSFWMGECLWATKVKNGKKVILMASTVFEKSGSEIAKILNDENGPVIATIQIEPLAPGSDGNA